MSWKQFKHIWAFGWNDKWGYWPCTFLLNCIVTITCFFGGHDYIEPQGTHCLLCDKERNLESWHAP